jgi:hypothetical protein
MCRILREGCELLYIPAVTVSLVEGFRSYSSQEAPAIAVVGKEYWACWRGRRGKFDWRVVMISSPFANGHKISRIDGLTYVDHLRAYGCFRAIPDREITQVFVLVNGKAWEVRRQLWRDCFNPNWGPSRDVLGLTKLRLIGDGDTLEIWASNGDGAGGYEVSWQVRSDGSASRRVREGS